MLTVLTYVFHYFSISYMLILRVWLFPYLTIFMYLYFILQNLNMEWGGEYSLDSSNLDCLLNVLPGESEFQQVLNDIDEKIKKNSSR